MSISDGTVTGSTSTGIAFDRAGPRGGQPLVLIHAGIADRRMWDPIWEPLTRDRDVLRLDLRGFGDSVAKPRGVLDPVRDVLDTLAELQIASCHLVAASFGAGVAVEVALREPTVVSSLFLIAPGGALISSVTEDLRDFIDAEDDAMSRGDLDAAAAANVRWWVDSPHRNAEEVDPGIRTAVQRMQRRAFELTTDWDDVEEHELDPPALQQLGEIAVPTLVLTGGLDLYAIADAAHAVTKGVPQARRVNWPDVAHLPSMERPAALLDLVDDFLAQQD